MEGIVVYLNGARGVATVRGIQEGGHQLVKVVVPAERRQKLGKDLSGTNVGIVGVPDVNSGEFQEELKKWRPTLGVVAGYSTIFKAPLIDIPEYGTINLHAGRLPEYRGGSPLNWQILNGEIEAGLSIIRVTEGIDTGPVLKESRVEIAEDDTIADLHRRANEEFPRLVVETLEAFERGTVQEREQDEDCARYWHQRSDADGRIDFKRLNTTRVHDLVRAVTRPYPGAFAFVGARKVRIFSTKRSRLKVSGVPGRVVWIQGNGPFVVCKDEALLILDYQMEGEGASTLRTGMILE